MNRRRPAGKPVRTTKARIAFHFSRGEWEHRQTSESHLSAVPTSNFATEAYFAAVFKSYHIIGTSYKALTAFYVILQNLFLKRHTFAVKRDIKTKDKIL